MEEGGSGGGRCDGLMVSALQWHRTIIKCHSTEKNVCCSGVFVIVKTPL